jgi:predicted DNA-binding protein (MmcQ/YjbR family)
MTIETVRQICRALPAVTEDVKWGHDLCFCVGAKMFAAMDLDPPHAIAFKCTPESFGELVERPGIRPAPYMARNMWVQEEQLGEALDRSELEQLLRTSYELVVARMPKSRRPGAAANPAEAGAHVRRASASQADARSRARHVKKPIRKTARRPSARRRR